jgi:voltage-gated potassium channel
MIIEDYSLLDAIYMTTIAVTTVGFGEVKHLSDAGKLFTVLLLIFSWLSLGFVLARLTQFVVSGEVNKYFKQRRMLQTLEKMNHHAIICGFGRNGQQAAHTLKMHGVPFVVIENKSDLLDSLAGDYPDMILLKGDGTDDDVLKKAGIERARSLITTLPVDADNVFIVLSARALNPSIQIISRASESSSFSKLKKAGADSVIMPDRIGGMHMATLVSKPDVIEFIDFLSGEEGEAVNMESVSYEQLPAEIKDRSLDEVMRWRQTGVTCIGIKNPEGKFFINPPGSTLITKGMKVMVIGTRAQIDQMKEVIVDKRG